MNKYFQVQEKLCQHWVQFCIFRQRTECSGRFPWSYNRFSASYMIVSLPTRMVIKYTFIHNCCMVDKYWVSISRFFMNSRNQQIKQSTTSDLFHVTFKTIFVFIPTTMLYYPCISMFHWHAKNVKSDVRSRMMMMLTRTLTDNEIYLTDYVLLFNENCCMCLP